MSRRSAAIASDVGEETVSFVYWLFHALERKSYRHLLHWSDSGYELVIEDEDSFCSQVLAKNGMTTNIKSFVRQLNYYGWRRARPSGDTSDRLYFSHPHFVRGRPEFLPMIKRKTQSDHSQRMEVDALRAQLEEERKCNSSLRQHLAVASSALSSARAVLAPTATEGLDAAFDAITSVLGDHGGDSGLSSSRAVVPSRRSKRSRIAAPLRDGDDGESTSSPEPAAGDEHSDAAKAKSPRTDGSVGGDGRGGALSALVSLLKSMDADKLSQIATAVATIVDGTGGDGARASASATSAPEVESPDKHDSAGDGAGGSAQRTQQHEDVRPVQAVALPTSLTRVEACAMVTNDERRNYSRRSTANWVATAAASAPSLEPPSLAGLALNDDSNTPAVHATAENAQGLPSAARFGGEAMCLDSPVRTSHVAVQSSSLLRAGALAVSSWPTPVPHTASDTAEFFSSLLRPATIKSVPGALTPTTATAAATTTMTTTTSIRVGTRDADADEDDDDDDGAWLPRSESERRVERRMCDEGSSEMGFGVMREGSLVYSASGSEVDAVRDGPPPLASPVAPLMAAVLGGAAELLSPTAAPLVVPALPSPPRSLPDAMLLAFDEGSLVTSITASGAATADTPSIQGGFSYDADIVPLASAASVFEVDDDYDAVPGSTSATPAVAGKSLWDELGGVDGGDGGGTGTARVQSPLPPPGGAPSLPAGGVAIGSGGSDVSITSRHPTDALPVVAAAAAVPTMVLAARRLRGTSGTSECSLKSDSSGSRGHDSHCRSRSPHGGGGGGGGGSSVVAAAAAATAAVAVAALQTTAAVVAATASVTSRAGATPSNLSSIHSGHRGPPTPRLGLVQ